MDAQTLLQTMDIWSQWDSTFGEHAAELRQYFTAHPDTLRAIMLQMLASRSRQPAKKWLCKWNELKTSVPDPLLRYLLMGLAMKRGWYKGLPSQAETSALIAHENGRPVPPDASYEYSIIRIYGTHAYSSDYSKHCYKQGDTWYECLPEREAQQTYKIAHGACWALVDFPDTQVRDLLTYLIRVKHRQTAVWTMAQWGDEDAVARLLQIQLRTTHQGVLARIESVLPEIAQQRGITVEELVDSAIFTYGLNVQGERTWQVGEYTLRLAISPGGRMQRSIRGSDGKALRSRPSELEDAWKLIADEAKQLSSTLSVQRKRLEAAMKEQRGWSWAEWQSTIAAHLLPRHLARRLVWRISRADSPQHTYAFLDEQGSWHDAEGEPIQVSGEHHLRIAHPVEMTPAEHSRWQRYIVVHKISQPFKQMFRETYVLTPAEEQTRTYSNRFVAHVVANDTAHAPRRRGWQTDYGACRYDFQRHNIRAYLWIEHNYYNAHNVLQQIAFYPLDHGMVWSQPQLDLDPACLPLHDVPLVVFSEAMRDIDQCLVSASQGTDQHWDEDGPRRQHQSYDNQPPHRREQLLHELLPLLDLGDTIQIKGRCAFINGKRCEYRVDLGSGTIYIEPTGRYLCIVPRYEAKNSQKLYLPFEDNDPKTTEIISKILLLARDETITDASILRQLPTTKTVWT
jgi:hypothetical protein